MRFLSLRSPISLIAILVSGAIGLGLVTTACTVGEVPQSVGQAPDQTDDQANDQVTAYTDDDGDGIADGVDTDGDGAADFSIEDCPFCQVQARVTCRRPLIDENHDGIFDGVDNNCDGRIDVRFNTNPGKGGQGARCQSTTTVNGTKFSATCESAPGGGLTCECRRNDQLIGTCTQASNVCSTTSTNGHVKAVCCQF
jgi:hypothetical protein